MKLITTLAVACVLAIAALAQTPTPSPPKSGTVPITLDHDRVIIDVRLPLPGGSTKRVRAWVDNGNPDMWITAELADSLKLPLSGEPQPVLYGQARASQAPRVLIVGGVEIKMPAKVKAYAVIARTSVAPGMSAEISIPSSVLRDYDVTVDYLNRELTIGAPGSIRFQGTSVKASINPQSGLIQIPAKVAGEDQTLRLNLGSSFSFLAQADFLKLLKAHPQWPHMTGAVGPANMWGTDDEPIWQLTRIPSIQLGPVVLSDVAVAGAKSMGTIGGNALLNYRVGLDYTHSTVYFDELTKSRPPQMDVVGLTLRREPDKTYTVIGIASIEGKPCVADVMPNDVLISVDKTLVKGGTMGQVWSLLSGSPGEERELELSRDGKKFTVKAVVRRFLATK